MLLLHLLLVDLLLPLVFLVPLELFLNYYYYYYYSTTYLLVVRRMRSRTQQGARVSRKV